MLVSHGGFGWLLADLCCPRTTSHSSNKSHKRHIKGNGGLKRIIDQRTYVRPRPLDRNIVINTISFCKLWKCVLFFHSFSLNGSTDKDNNVFAWFSYYSILVQNKLSTPFFLNAILQWLMFPLLYIAINYNYIIKLFFDMYEYAMQINIAQIFLFTFSLNIYYL